MSLIQTLSDVNNTFLSRRELTCDFTGLAGKLKKLEAIDMVTKEFNLDNKVVIPIRLKSHAGKSTVTGTFFVYDDEGLAKKHVNPTVFSRLEKSKSKKAEAQKAEESKEAEGSEGPNEDSSENKELEVTETKSEEPSEPKEEKSE